MLFSEELEKTVAANYQASSVDLANIIKQLCVKELQSGLEQHRENSKFDLKVHYHRIDNTFRLIAKKYPRINPDFFKCLIRMYDAELYHKVW